MMDFDTARSDKITKDFLAKDAPYKRKVMVFSGEYSASPEAVFAQFCPSREADWINGWAVELIYTKSGYAEPLCVFRTPESNLLGAGLWMLTRVEPSSLLEAVMVHDGSDIFEHMRLDVVDLNNGRCSVTWTITFTALSETGNSMIANIPDDVPSFVEDLEYFLTNGALRPLAA